MRTMHRRTTIRLLLTVAFGGMITAAAAVATGEAHAVPGQCVQTPWGGFCDGPMLPNGTYHHCEGAMGFANCFYVRPAPVEVDPRGWVPA